MAIDTAKIKAGLLFLLIASALCLKIHQNNSVQNSKKMSIVQARSWDAPSVSEKTSLGRNVKEFLAKQRQESEILSMHLTTGANLKVTSSFLRLQSDHPKPLETSSDFRKNVTLVSPDRLYVVRYVFYTDDLSLPKKEDMPTRENIEATIQTTRLERSRESLKAFKRYKSVGVAARAKENTTSSESLTAMNNLYSIDFDLKEAKILLPKWWLSNNGRNDASKQPYNDNKCCDTCKQYYSLKQHRHVSSSVDIPEDVQKTTLVAFILDESLMEESDDGSVIVERYGRWFYDWMRWHEQTKKQTASSATHNTAPEIDTIRAMIHFFENNNTKECGVELDNGSSLNISSCQSGCQNLKAFATRKERGTGQSLLKDKLGKDFGVKKEALKESQFYNRSSIPSNRWPGKLDRPGKSKVHNAALLYQRYFKSSHIVSPVVAMAEYEVNDYECLTLPESEEDSSLNSSRELDHSTCYAFLDISRLMKSWISGVKPWRRRNANLSLVFYERYRSVPDKHSIEDLSHVNKTTLAATPESNLDERRARDITEESTEKFVKVTSLFSSSNEASSGPDLQTTKNVSRTAGQENEIEAVRNGTFNDDELVELDCSCQKSNNLQPVMILLYRMEGEYRFNYHQ